MHWNLRTYLPTLTERYTEIHFPMSHGEESEHLKYFSLLNFLSMALAHWLTYHRLCLILLKQTLSSSKKPKSSERIFEMIWSSCRDGIVTLASLGSREVRSRGQ